MTNISSSANAKVRNFAQLSSRYQRAVGLKAGGATHLVIATTLSKEFKQPCSKYTVNQWFIAGGLLEQPLLELREELAVETVSNAKLSLMIASNKAVEVLEELLKPKYNGHIRVQAARAILNKYIPDRQTSKLITSHDDELPEELIEEGTEILAELDRVAARDSQV